MWPEVYRNDIVRARKDHRCYECKGVIRKGELYQYHHGVWDGRGASFRLCFECHALLNNVNADYTGCSDDPLAFGELEEAIFERRDPNEMRAFIENKRKRGSPISDWMIDRKRNR